MHMVWHDFHFHDSPGQFVHDKLKLPFELGFDIPNKDLLPVLCTPHQVELERIDIPTTMRKFLTK